MSGQIPFAATCRIDHRRKTFACECLETKRAIQNKFYANEGHGALVVIGEFAPLGAITEEHFDKTFNANVKGLLFTVHRAKALPLLKDGAPSF